VNAERRQQLAEAVRALVPQTLRAVTESWPDLMPVSVTWRAASAKRARASARAVLEGIVPLVEQGDLDDQTWERTREVVHGRGFATREEVAELLRSVRVVGVEMLTDGLEDLAGLTHAERWEFQREVSAYCDELLGEDEEPEGAAYAETLAEMERTGPDIR
jgi:hypothetical protein